MTKYELLVEIGNFINELRKDNDKIREILKEKITFEHRCYYTGKKEVNDNVMDKLYDLWLEGFGR